MSFSGVTATVTRRYRCQVCRRESEARESIAAPLLTVCAFADCRSPSLRPLPAAGVTVLFRGGQAGRLVNGDQRFRRPEVVREKDGRETVYTSLEQMRRAELERVSHPKIAEDNVRRAAKRLLPHTDAARYQSAIEERVA